MRHLHFTQSLEPLQGGGLGSSAIALHRQMLACGNPSSLCATHGGIPQQQSGSVHEFPRIKPDFAYFSPALFQARTGLIREADVVHGHGLYVGTNLVLGREARKQAKPLVYHVQGMFEPYILQRSRWKKRLVHWLFENENIRQVRLWRALTEKEAAQIRSCGHDAPIVVAPNGIELGDYGRPAMPGQPLDTPLIPGLRKNRRRLLFMARVHPKKGLDLLLQTWADLRAKHSDWELVIAGPDECGYLKAVQQLTVSLDVRQSVSFTGTVTGKTKTALLHSADLFVLPSYSEGMPMSLLEAMACELPVVATTSCNLPTIRTAGAGWECEARAESLARVLAEALSASAEELQQRGRNGRRLVETEYSWPSIVSKIIEACHAHCS